MYLWYNESDIFRESVPTGCETKINKLTLIGKSLPITLECSVNKLWEETLFTKVVDAVFNSAFFSIFYKSQQIYLKPLRSGTQIGQSIWRDYSNQIPRWGVINRQITSVSSKF